MSGTFDVLTPLAHLREQIAIIERAGRVCYQSAADEITTETGARFVRMLIARGHESVLEHSAMSVLFSGCSRGFTHELVRHRLASFSQESTRYVRYEEGDDLPFVQGSCLSSEREAVEACFAAYRSALASGARAENARQVLPIGIVSQIVMTANLREWRHVFELRCDKPAHWEIRGVMCRLLEWCQAGIPGVFDDFVRADDHRGVRVYVRRWPDAAFNRQAEMRRRP